jgi:hypothetical protein
MEIHDVTPTPIDPEPPLPRRKPKRRRWPVVTLAAVLLGGASAGIVIGASSGTNAGTFTLNGSITVTDPTGWVDTVTHTIASNATALDACVTGSGYADITADGSVVIGDSSGKTIAVGQLKSGIVGRGLTGCEFDFSITGVPDGQSFYAVSVTHRGSSTFSAAQAQAGVALTLGG